MLLQKEELPTISVVIGQPFAVHHTPFSQMDEFFFAPPPKPETSAFKCINTSKRTKTPSRPKNTINFPSLKRQVRESQFSMSTEQPSFHFEPPSTSQETWSRKSSFQFA
jgi:hypothetical protein